MIGARLQALRLNAGLEQEVVAREAHVSVEVYAQVEAGDRSLTVEQLPGVLDAVGATVQDVYPSEPRLRVVAAAPDETAVHILSRPDGDWVEQAVNQVFRDAGLGDGSPLALKVAQAVVAQAHEQARAETVVDVMLVESLPLNRRTYNSLKRAGLNSVGDVHRFRMIPFHAGSEGGLLAFASTKNLWDMKGVGAQSVLEIVEALAEIGFPHPQDAEVRRFCQ